MSRVMSREIDKLCKVKGLNNVKKVAGTVGVRIIHVQIKVARYNEVARFGAKIREQNGEVIKEV